MASPPIKEDCNNTGAISARQTQTSPPRSSTIHAKPNNKTMHKIITTPSTKSSSNLIRPRSMTLPILLPALDQILLSPSQDGDCIADHAQDGGDSSSMFEWQLPSFPQERQQGNETRPTPMLQQQQARQQTQPMDEAFSILLTQKAPSVRFAKHNEICYYEALPSHVANSPANTTSSTSSSTEEGFQMDHVFDNIETVTATPPLAPPRRCPSIESFESHSAHDNPHTELQADTTSFVLRASMPRHGSVESETTLSFSASGDCSIQDDDDEDTLSGEFSLEEGQHFRDAGFIIPTGTLGEGDLSNGSIVDESLIEEIMETVRVGATRDNEPQVQGDQLGEDLRLSTT